MKTIKIELNCCMCGMMYHTQLTLPDGWESYYTEATIPTGFCPKHVLVKQWADAQCSGCAGSWADCALWNDFACHLSQRNLTEQDFETIKSGICPRRVSGSLRVSNTEGVEILDDSEKASAEAGEAFVIAIKKMWAWYDDKSKKQLSKLQVLED